MSTTADRGTGSSEQAQPSDRETSSAAAARDSGNGHSDFGLSDIGHASQSGHRQGHTDGPLEDELDEAFNRLVDEGTQRLGRSWMGILITGFFGGTEIGVGVLALLVVYYETDNILLGGLAFSIGFLALLLAKSELFTESFLLPVISVASGRARPRHLAKLWGGVLVANLVGGWCVMWLIVWGYPDLHDKIDELALGYLEAGLSAEGISLAVIGGAAITLMTRMQSGSSDMLPKIVSAIAIAFLLGAGHLYHLIVGSLFVFGSLHINEAGLGYGDFLGWFWWVLLGNMAGGLGLVTLLRLLRSKDRLFEERNHVRQQQLKPGPTPRSADGMQEMQAERRKERKDEERRTDEEAERLEKLDEDAKADRFRHAGPHKRDG